MTYSEKLKDPRWVAFRNDFVSRRLRDMGEGDKYCPECGEDSGLNPRWHVHHRRYFTGREPWDYDDDEDLRLICGPCHERVHALEERARDFIRAMAPNVCFEFAQVMAELEAAQARGLLKIALAHAKNAIRGVAQT